MVRMTKHFGDWAYQLCRFDVVCQYAAYDALYIPIVSPAQCMSELLSTLSHFNFHANVAGFLVARAVTGVDPEAVAISCEAIRCLFVGTFRLCSRRRLLRLFVVAPRAFTASMKPLFLLFAGDASGEATALAVRSMAAAIKAAAERPGGLRRVRPEAIATLQHLRVGALEAGVAGGAAGREFVPQKQRGGKKAKKAAGVKGSKDPFDEADVLAGKFALLRKIAFHVTGVVRPWSRMTSRFQV